MSECVADHGCITCGDVAIPMRIVDIDRSRGLALCAAAAGQRESVEVALVEPVDVGDWLLVHAGTALTRTDAPQSRTEAPRSRTEAPRPHADAPESPTDAPRSRAGAREQVPA